MAVSAVTHQQLLIDGEWREAADAGVTTVVNPFHGREVTIAAAAGLGDVDAAVAAAAGALAGWSATPADERAEILRRAAGLLRERADEIAVAVMEEAGGTGPWGGFNCTLAADILGAAADVAGQVDEEVELASTVPGLRSMAVRRPLGVCVAIAPWNAPVILGTRAVAWPLAFGNTVVFKGSEATPRVHGAIVRALHDAGVPAGAISYLANAPDRAPELVNALIEHPDTAHINFTGSTRVGRIIAQAAAGQLKRTLLELGGKAPFVVLADADLDAAVAAAGFGAFMNAGQICMSTERIIAVEEVAERFTAQLAARVAGLPVGSPFDAGTAVGPVVSVTGANHVRELLADARALGAEVHGGEEISDPASPTGALLAPAVVAGVTPEMRIYSEESFGPVVAVITARDSDDAVRIANDSDFGLSAAVFGADVEAARVVADRIHSGICHINGATVHDEAAAPFGGVGASGWGRFGAGEVVHEFTIRRWMTVSEQPRHYPI